MRRPTATGVLHFGLGAFHRAHQAHFFDRLIAQGQTDWGIAAVNLRSAAIVEDLSAQDNLYFRWERGLKTESIRAIGAHTHCHHLPTEREAVLDHFRSAALQMITITVSEKGYHFDPRPGGLDTAQADVQVDLSNPSLPATLPAVLAQGLEERRKVGAGPITLVSCDNYRNNGQVLKSVVTDFARACYPDLSDWLAANASFPSSMVDAIVPKVRAEDRDALQKKIGVADPAMVIVEDYMRWVIEDDFVSNRPPLNTVGVELVPDAAPYEVMKLMLLNAPHSAVAYLGCLAGFDFIHQAIACNTLRASVDRMLRRELLPVARGIAGAAAADYGGMTLNRFANPNIEYRTLQVATDGSLKIQQRLLPALSWHLKQGSIPEGLTLTLAAWMRYLMGVTDAGTSYQISDPMAEELTDRIADTRTGEEVAHRILSIGEIFPSDIQEHDDLAAQTARHLDGISSNGTLKWLEHLSNSNEGMT